MSDMKTTQPICSSTVIGSQFTAPHESNLIVTRYSGGDLVITDSKNTIMLTVTKCDTTFHSQRLLKDECGRPIATLRAKNMTAHARWNVFRGESIDDSDIIFSATADKKIRNRSHVNVSLANKKSSSDDYDFQIKGNLSNRNYDIYKHDSSTTIAQMNQGGIKDKFMVKINPDMDYAFVVALIAIVDAMKSHGRIKVGPAQIAAGVAVKLFVVNLLLV